MRSWLVGTCGAAAVMCGRKKEAFSHPYSIVHLPVSPVTHIALMGGHRKRGITTVTFHIFLPNNFSLKACSSLPMPGHVQIEGKGVGFKKKDAEALGRDVGSLREAGCLPAAQSHCLTPL